MHKEIVTRYKIELKLSGIQNLNDETRYPRLAVQDLIAWAKDEYPEEEILGLKIIRVTEMPQFGCVKTEVKEERKMAKQLWAEVKKETE